MREPKEVPYVVRSQGHWHIDFAVFTERRPGFMKFHIETEQKRPSAFANVGFPSDERMAHIVIHSRDTPGESMNFREGEDGSVSTDITVRMPKTLPGRHWRMIVEDDKWGIAVVAWTEKLRAF